MPYLIRHTTPAIAKGICYGQADLEVTDSFEQEAATIMRQIAQTPPIIYSSPLLRCKKLAIHLGEAFGIKEIYYEEALREMNFGTWELQKWNDIPENILQPWMDDFVNIQVPDGESFSILHQRVQAWWLSKISLEENALIVSHAGPIRSILSAMYETPLKEAFTLYPMSYGALFKI